MDPMSFVEFLVMSYFNMTHLYKSFCKHQPEMLPIVKGHFVESTQTFSGKPWDSPDT